MGMAISVEMRGVAVERASAGAGNAILTMRPLGAGTNPSLLLTFYLLGCSQFDMLKLL